jgi:leader peptidase (prepilin peptidase) / N-methyltransferase
MRAPDAKAWVRIALALFAFAFISYMILLPAADAIFDAYREKPKKISQVQTDMTYAEQVRLRTIEGMTAFLFFGLGAAVGSFLNVVVYRMPLGISLVFQRSRCPGCGTQIAGRDNMPILGWLMLGGRCRACQTAISLRYPTIEMIVGTFFLLFYFVELVSGGINLPNRVPNMYAGVVWIVFYTKWDLITIYLFHCVMLCLLLALALVNFDRKRLPIKAIVQFLLLLAIPAIFFHHLLLVKIPKTIFGVTMPVWSQGLVTVAAGASLGLLAAQAVSYVCRRWTALDKSDEYHFAAGLVLVGVALGWQAVLTTLLFACVLKLVWSLLPIRAQRKEPLATENMTIPNEEMSEASESQDGRQEQSAIQRSAIQRSAIQQSAIQRSAILSKPVNLSLSMFLFVAVLIHHAGWRWIYGWLPF